MRRNFMKKIIKIFLLGVSKIYYGLYLIKHLITPNSLRRKNKLQLKIEEDLVKETFKEFSEHFKKSLLFNDRWEIREYSIKRALSNDKRNEYYYLEFGTYKGESTNFFSRFVDKLYCFDSFEGLKEDWIGLSYAKGHFNLDKKIPKLNSNIYPVIGWVEDTLDDFLSKHTPKINFVHFDMDTYSPTRFALEKIKPYLTKNAIIIFDELYNYVGWENGEYKALKEVFNEKEFVFKAFSLIDGKVVIQKI
tara:strand:- start:159 stop:902 length:744 start_codon:yes stop_codon:yes gene_type:complete